MPGEWIEKADVLLREFVERVTRRLGRCAVLLFGSRARGDNLSYSDFDVAVVVEKVEDRISLIEELRSLKPRGLPLDLIVLEVVELEDPIVRRMLKDVRLFANNLGMDL